MNGQIKAKPEFYFAVAISKNDPAIPAIWAAYNAEARAGYANNKQVLSKIDMGLSPNTGFAWKISDGDSRERKDKPGQAGCWIFKFKTTWEIKCVDANNAAINPIFLRTGYYADVFANIAPNGKVDHTSGLYANPVFVRWLFQGHGEEIHPGPQANAVMGAAPSQLPPGATSSQPMGMSVPGMGAPSPGYAPAPAPHVGYQAPPHQAPQAPNAMTYPSSNPMPQPGGPVSGPAATAPGLPAGAQPMQAQPASPTASPSNTPAIAGFAHGNPQQ
jgi:hypothetical protein